MEEKVYIDEEIDLRELFKTIWERRIFILIFTFTVTFIACIYVFFKNPIPIYEGKMLIEIGEIQSETFGIEKLDNTNDLTEIIESKFNVSIVLPKKTSSLLVIISNDIDKNVIKGELTKTLEFILERHKEKSNYYKNTIATEKIGDISISSEPINKPKKKLIVLVSFLTGFILSIFLVFLMQFVNRMRKS